MAEGEVSVQANIEKKVLMHKRLVGSSNPTSLFHQEPQNDVPITKVKKLRFTPGRSTMFS